MKSIYKKTGYIAFLGVLFVFGFTNKALSQVIFSTPGTYTWTVPACVTQITVQVWGGGGGGGGVSSYISGGFNTDNEACSAGGGGGGGGFVSRTYTVIPGEVYTIVVGAGGAGGTGTNGSSVASNGGTGGTSTFSGPATVVPGILTAFGGGFGGGASTNNNNLGYHIGTNGLFGTGGGGLNGTTTHFGGNGASGKHDASCWDQSGGGGGGAGTTSNGGNAVTLVCYGSQAGGIGGASFGGSGGNGRGGGMSNTSYPGNAGNVIGGAGGGALIHIHDWLNSWMKSNGGAGARGEVRIIYNSGNLIPPIFTALGPYCVGATPGSLPTTSINGITGVWNPATVTTAAAGTTVYTFTPAIGQCANDTTMSITVNANITPAFTALGPYCVGATPGSLPSTSTNGITGTWNPATISTAAAGTTVYTFTPATGQCANATTMSVTVNTNITPVFTALGPYCVGATPGPLPTTSTNGITGTWNPATISTAAAGTTVYTFTPTTGQCANATTMSVTVNANITPAFTALGPYCVGAAPGSLPSTSTNGVTGTWNPATISTAAAGTTVYTFTPTTGQCANASTMSVTVNANITPAFSALGPYCVGATPGSLPTTSTNGITGTWNPATISTAAAGTTVYTFTPTTGLCANATTMSVTVNTNITPAFTALGPYCVGATPGSLPTTSTNGITGTWNPATVSTAAAGTTVYTFTPTAGLCANATTMSVTVNTNITPAFSALGPYCVGATPGSLPTTSTNGITGTWNPATVSTAAAGTTVYTFTPTAGQCANATTMSVTVNANITPAFTALGPYCVGAAPGSLPTTSTNGVTGTWNPATISTAAAGTTVYTFTPTTGQCANATTMSVTVNAQTVPNFAAIPAFCAGDIPPVLATTSPNGISGTWSPAVVNNTTGGTYTFTPNAGQCATPQTLSVTVNPIPIVTVSTIPVQPVICAGQSTNLNGSGANSYSWIPGNMTGNSVDVYPTVTTIYTVTGSSLGCTNSATITVNVNPLPTIVVNPSSICVGESSTLTGGGAATYTWNPGNLTGTSVVITPAVTTSYTVIGTSASGCTGSASVTVIVNPLPVITANANPANICSGQCTNLMANGGATYTWLPGSQSGQTIQVCPAVSSVYTVTGTSAAGCTGSGTVIVTVSTTINITVSPQQDTICNGSSTQLTASGASFYSWSPAITLSGSTGSQVSASPGTTTVYTVFGTNNDGCTGTATATVMVFPDVPFNFTMMPSEGCEPLTVDFVFDTNNTLIDQNSLVYHFDDPTSSNNSSVGVYATHIFDEHGFYHVTLSANTIYGCPVLYTDTVRVFKVPVADFSIHPEVIYVTDPLVYFYDQSYNATTWDWNFGDQTSINANTSFLQNPTHLYSDTGSYQIILVVSNGHNCFDTAVHSINILPPFLFWLPNAFTPDGDATNNHYYGKGVGFRTDDFEMYVYDRWGKLMYSKTGYDETGWDGTYMNKGKKCEQGVYTYLILLTELGGIRHAYKGVIFLIQ